MSDPPPIPEGTIVAGKLRVVRLLGSGGMGAVYEVEHEFTKHRRALKLLHAEMLQHPMVVSRFLREASAAGHIGNPHIVETFDAGTLNSGEPYIVMEILSGETLDARLSRLGRLPLDELVDVVRQACDGVQAAHDAGIVHRDLKPENIFLVDRGGKAFVKILDFGVSKFDPALTGTNGTTKEGAALGTPYYMSPEQVDGDKDLDARTDLYALGVILYECASGERPFRADALPKLAVLIHEGRPTPMSDRRPDLPPGFADVVQKAMARDRDQRYATARELGSALEPFGAVALDATMLEQSVARPGRSSRPPVVVARSGPPATGTLVAKLPALTEDGSARSVAGSGEKTERRSSVVKVAGLVAAAAMVVGVATVLVVGRASNPTGHSAAGTGATVTEPVVATTAEPTALVPAAPSVPPTVALAPLPSPGAVPTAESSASAKTATVVNPTGSAKVARSASPAIPSATSKPPPTGTSRVEQRGLARDNPF